MPILTTKGSFRNFQTSSFVMQNKEICCLSFIILKQIVSFFFQLGLKYRQSLNTLLKTNVIENNPSTKLTELDTNGFCSM